MTEDDLTTIDKTQYLPDGHPIITPERASKGDVFTGPDCKDCDTTGKDRMTKLPCKSCKGRGWTASINAASIETSNIRFAEVREVTLLQCLWDRNHITDQQHSDAQMFQIWGDMHKAQHGLKRHNGFGENDVLAIRLRAYGYVLILLKLNQHDHLAVNNSLLPMPMTWGQWIARNRMETYITALGTLSRLIPPIKDRITYLEGLAEEQRLELSEANLQKLVARLRQPV